MQKLEEQGYAKRDRIEKARADNKHNQHVRLCKIGENRGSRAGSQRSSPGVDQANVRQATRAGWLPRYGWKNVSKYLEKGMIIGSYLT
jgi:hypothetical protein